MHLIIFFSLTGTLVLLNLNDNNLTTLFPSINQLTSLKQLSISNNSLSRLPAEICSLYTLEELHLDSNRLARLPQELGKLMNLKKLLLQKNNLTALPSSIGQCRKLLTLDVSGNQFDIFPAELQILSLQEIHFENNPLLPFVPVPADQYEEVLPLKVHRCSACSVHNLTLLFFENCIVSARMELEVSGSILNVVSFFD